MKRLLPFHEWKAEQIRNDSGPEYPIKQVFRSKMWYHSHYGTYVDNYRRTHGTDAASSRP